MHPNKRRRPEIIFRNSHPSTIYGQPIAIECLPQCVRKQKRQKNTRHVVSFYSNRQRGHDIIKKKYPDHISSVSPSTDFPKFVRKEILRRRRFFLCIVDVLAINVFGIPRQIVVSSSILPEHSWGAETSNAK